MTREEFEKIEAEKGFYKAINEFADECDEIIATSSLEEHAKELIDMGYYRDAEDICSALKEENYTGYWIYENASEIISVNNIEDIEYLFE